MTEKLYYADAFISEFTATVLSVEPSSRGYIVVLDKTAFFPEEGGQTCDRGYIRDSFVSEVKENDGVIYHLVDRPFEVGEGVACRILFDERYEKMQCHTAEHIVSGIIYKLYGYDNVGFHLSRDYVTFDVSAPLGRKELDRVEELANRAVADNLEVRAYFPSTEQLDEMNFRAKSGISGDVRIVSIGDIDSCACCAPHVKLTGECGVIKLLDFEKHKNGVRVYMLAGFKALRDYRARYETAYRISALTSTPQADIADEVERMVAEHARLTAALRARGLRIAELLSEGLPFAEGSRVYLYSDMTVEELRHFVNAAILRHTGAVVALTPRNGGYSYVLGSGTLDVADLTRRANKALSGKGGGRGGISQGSFCASFEEIKAFFENK